MSDSEEFISSQFPSKASSVSQVNPQRGDSPFKGNNQSRSPSQGQTPKDHSIGSRNQSQSQSLSQSRTTSQRQSRSYSLSGSRPQSQSRTESLAESRGESLSNTRSEPARTRTGSRGGLDFKNLSENTRRNLSFGAKFNCGMSTIRKYLCLFVLVDVAVHSLLYFQYIQQHIDGFHLVDLIGCQMKCYNLQSSFVDILLVAIGRFVLLESFYGIYRGSSWAPVSLTTALSSVLILVKPFSYDWELECQKLWPVIMMITTFIFSWLEAFLVDLRLVRMEELARKFADAKPESYRKDLARLGLAQAIWPITSGLVRSVFRHSNSLTLFPQSYQ